MRSAYIHLYGLLACSLYSVYITVTEILFLRYLCHLPAKLFNYVIGFAVFSSLLCTCYFSWVHKKTYADSLVYLFEVLRCLCEYNRIFFFNSFNRHSNGAALARAIIGTWVCFLQVSNHLSKKTFRRLNLTNILSFRTLNNLKIFAFNSCFKALYFCGSEIRANFRCLWSGFRYIRLGVLEA